MKTVKPKYGALTIIFLLAALFLSKGVFGQTAIINLDYTGSNGFSACGGSDITYTNASGSVPFSGGLPTGAVITNINVSANLGQFLNGTTTFSWTLNGIAIGNIAGVTSTCQNNNFNASTVAPYINTGTNNLAFTGSGTATRGVYNVTITVTYTSCTPPAAPSVTTPVNYCKNATASALTATGTNLIWYASDGVTVLPGAPTPSTSSAGTTSYYVSQSNPIGCEGPKEQIDVIVNALPVASVTNQSNITCFAANDGSITVMASGGSGTGYMFSVNDGSTWQGPTVGLDKSVFTGLLPNTAYRIRVKDSNNCISK